MNIKALLSGLALCTAMAISAPAFADTMVGSDNVTDADLPAVQGRCTELMTSADTPESISTSSDNKVSTTNEQPDKADTSNSNNSMTATVDPLANPILTQVLDRLTLENCKAAGLLK